MRLPTPLPLSQRPLRVLSSRFMTWEIVLSLWILHISWSGAGVPNLCRMVPPFPLASETDTCGVSGWWQSVKCGASGLWDRGCSIMVILSKPSSGQKCQAFLRDFPHCFPAPQLESTSFWTFAISVSLPQRYIPPQIPLDGSLHNISNPRPLAPSHLFAIDLKPLTGFWNSQLASEWFLKDRVTLKTGVMAVKNWANYIMLASELWLFSVQQKAGYFY